jgi:hypothetical protein
MTNAWPAGTRGLSTVVRSAGRSRDPVSASASGHNRRRPDAGGRLDLGSRCGDVIPNRTVP